MRITMVVVLKCASPNYEDYKGRCIERSHETRRTFPLEQTRMSTIRPKVLFLLQIIASLWKNHGFLLPYFIHVVRKLI
ncbi:hypothetical protein MtrunA17_Chr6g0485951 [Medicago truncatula]|uniref:Transmembrane protein n=1 Tax=Medicago truncatula TaxID=3880 RepID=A0A396HHV6_MEDTR|nr:hypothetical protein MtrunA17_Chr6g0485951 [Medicago truncatula]